MLPVMNHLFYRYLFHFINRVLMIRPREYNVFIIHSYMFPNNLIDAIKEICDSYIKVGHLILNPNFSYLNCLYGDETFMIIDIGYYSINIIGVINGIVDYSNIIYFNLENVKKLSSKLIQSLNINDIDSGIDLWLNSNCVKCENDIPDYECVELFEKRINSELRSSGWEDIFKLNDERESLISKIIEFIKNSPIDSRKELISHIMILGGLSETSGLCKRIKMELERDLEMSELNRLREYVGFKDSEFAPSLVYWLSCSLFSSLLSINR